MSRNQSPSLQAAESIPPSRFVAVSTSADNTGILARGNVETIGISGVGAKDSREDAGNSNHADSGDAIELLAEGDIGLLLSASGWTRGDTLRPDGAGRGFTTTTSGDWVGAKALENAAALEFGRVQVVRYKR